MCNYIIYIMSTYNTERHIPDYTQDIYERGQLYRAHFNYLNEIKDKSLVLSVLCSKSCSLFSRIRTFINIPLILSSGAMTILNSMNDTDSTSIKYANIVLNSCTVTILSLIGNFKLTERELTYRNTHLKMKRLYHRVDSILRVDTTKINSQIVGEITKEYLNIYMSILIILSLSLLQSVIIMNSLQIIKLYPTIIFIMIHLYLILT